MYATVLHRTLSTAKIPLGSPGGVWRTDLTCFLPRQPNVAVIGARHDDADPSSKSVLTNGACAIMGNHSSTVTPTRPIPQMRLDRFWCVFLGTLGPDQQSCTKLCQL